MKRGKQTPEDIKYLLGTLGIEIFNAIDKGAKDIETIKIFSGISVECINGRIPVLIDLNLIVKSEKGFVLTSKGINFKRLNKKSF